MGFGGHFLNGIIDYAGANTPGWTSNLGINLSAGTFSIVDAQGATLTKSNPGWITVRSTTAGRLATLKVTTGGSFIDDAGSSNIIGELFGVTTGIAWGNDVPFFLYVVNRANSNIDGADGSSAFFISRDPKINTTPGSADNIGDTGAVSVNKTKNVIFILDDVTIANYVNLPCQVIGAFRMRMSASNDWTVQSLLNSDGIGRAALDATLAGEWTFPAGQMGASAGFYSAGTGGETHPVWTTSVYTYQLSPNGHVKVTFVFDGDGGTDGASANDYRVTLPYKADTPSSIGITYGLARVTGGGAFADNGIRINLTNGNSYVTFNTLTGSSGTTLDFNEFSAGARHLSASFDYRAF